MRILAAILAFVLVSDFDFDLPEELIAQEPLSDRASSRMLVVHRESGALEDKHFRDFPEFVDQGDCLVVNDSRVFPSRLFGTRGNGTARVEVFLVRPLNGEPLVWQALVRPGRKVPVGERIIFSHDLSAEIIDRSEHGERTIRFSPVSDLLARLEEIGHTPLPPYIRRTDTPEDRVRYQTVFAHSPGSVAAPTAGLHFTPLILDQCRAKGVTLAKITLHVGLGTFAPVNVTQVEDVRLHRERYSIEPETLSQIRNASRRICVGTTSVRTVETVYRTGVTAGETDIFISPGFEFLATGAMLTNFHLPASSLLMLVSALAGRDLIKKAYRHAVQQKYRFYSYGDCMLIL